MPRIVITESDFLLLSAKADQAAEEIKKKPPDRVVFPPGKKEDPSIEAVSATDLFLTTLYAMARATRKLKGSDIAIDMGSRPLEMKFTGTITGISKEDRDIYLKLEI